MKIFMYSEGKIALKKSGIGRSTSHQIKQFKAANIEYTFDPTDTFDLVHCNTVFDKSRIVVSRMQKKGFPVVVHGHSTKEDFANSFALWRLIRPWFNKILKRIYSRADYIITPTAYSKKLIENYPFVSCPVINISNGIDLDDYQYDERNANLFREYFKIKPSDKVIISAGHYFERKGILDFIDVARSLAGYLFIWFGHLDKIMTTRKVRLAMKNKPHNVVFPGYVPIEVLKGAFCSADLLFFPTYEENEGIVVLEAIASKLPMVLRNISVYEGWLQKDIHCYMGKNNNEFIRLINKALYSDNKEKIEQSYQVAKERSCENIGKKYKEVFEMILKKSKE